MTIIRDEACGWWSFGCFKNQAEQVSSGQLKIQNHRRWPGHPGLSERGAQAAHLSYSLKPGVSFRVVQTQTIWLSFLSTWDLTAVRVQHWGLRGAIGIHCSCRVRTPQQLVFPQDASHPFRFPAHQNHHVIAAPEASQQPTLPAQDCSTVPGHRTPEDRPCTNPETPPLKA